MKDFKQLKVWVKAHKLTRKVYHVTTFFPKDELYALTSQLRRAAASIPTNVAEGCGRRSDNERGQYPGDTATVNHVQSLFFLYKLEVQKDPGIKIFQVFQVFPED